MTRIFALPYPRLFGGVVSQRLVGSGAGVVDVIGDGGGRDGGGGCCFVDGVRVVVHRSRRDTSNQGIQ